MNDFLVVATTQTKAPLQIYVSSLSLILDSEGFKVVIKFQSPLSLLRRLSPALWEAENLALLPVVVCLKVPEFSGNHSHHDRIHTCGAAREEGSEMEGGREGGSDEEAFCSVTDSELVRHPVWLKS